jgi:FixJ family two-component response regulator
MQARGVSDDIIYVAVVDDDESVCRSFSRLLRTAGFQPVTYASAEAFLQDVKRPRFDCLVLDIQLGGMSGLELSRRLAAVRDATPVIFITAHDAPEVQSEALARGCGGYFHKHDPGPLVVEAIWRVVRGVPGKDTKSSRPSGKPIPKKP